LSAQDKYRQNKKDQIVEAAALVFARSGYSNAVVADIALQANIGKGTVYAYSKKDPKRRSCWDIFSWRQRR
jgi:AcrR family transcriptional regulator